MRNGLTDHAEAILAQRQYAVSKGDLAAGADNFSFCLRGNRHRVLAAVNRNDHTVRAVCGDSLVGNVTLAMVKDAEVAAVEGFGLAEVAQGAVVVQQVGTGGVIQVVPGEGESAEGIVVAFHAHLVAVVDRGDAKDGELQGGGQLEEAGGLLSPFGGEAGGGQLGVNGSVFRGCLPGRKGF